MRTTIELRHSESGLAKNFSDRDEVIAFIQAEADPDAWEGWKNLNIQLPEKAQAPAAPVAPPAPKANAAAKKAPAAKKGGKK